MAVTIRMGGQWILDTVIIMTSNIGSQHLLVGCRYGSSRVCRGVGSAELRAHFRRVLKPCGRDGDIQAA